MDKIKNWLIEVGIKKMGPSAVRGAVLGISGWLITKEGVLAPFGIVSDAVAHTTVVYWDKLNVALIAILPAAGAAVIKMLNHEGNKLVPKKPEQE